MNGLDLRQRLRRKLPGLEEQEFSVPNMEVSALFTLCFMSSM